MPILFDEDAPPNVGGKPGADAMDLVATHQRLLIGACLRTTGPILELGVGWYSTPLLHEIAEVQNRFVRTIDNNNDWLAQFKGLQSDWHHLDLVGWWGEANFTLSKSMSWSVVFVDQGQPIEREYAIRRLLSNEQGKNAVFVMHDTEELIAYGYERILPMFQYRYTDKCQKTWTTVASNSVRVDKWFHDLPEVNSTVEIT